MGYSKLFQDNTNLRSGQIDAKARNDACNKYDTVMLQMPTNTQTYLFMSQISDLCVTAKSSTKRQTYW